MAANVPDDWGMYYRRCDDCGERWHLSEGWHDCPMDDKPEPEPEPDGHEHSDGDEATP